MSFLQPTKPHPPYAFLLSLLPGLTPRHYHSLIGLFNSSEQVLTTPASQLKSVSQEDKLLIADFQKYGSNSQLVNMAESILDKLAMIDTHLIHFEDARYPELLKQIHSPPPVLYVKGNMDILHLPQLAIVGSRHASIQGKKNTRLFAEHLSQSGFTITSGLALGVDHVAHHASLAASGSTIAVMATGIEQVYPKQHQHLAQDIIANGGALISEFPLGSQPVASRFPKRNRIISGLSMGVLVTEAAMRSGSLITARCAMEQGREVFAIPGSIHNPQSRGCHHLIKQGATLVEKSSDIVEHLSGFLEGVANSQAQLNEKLQSASVECLSTDEATILEHISFDALTLEELIQQTGISSQKVSQALIHLEVSGKVQRSHRGYEKV